MMGKNKESVSLLSIIKCVLSDCGVANAESYAPASKHYSANLIS